MSGASLGQFALIVAAMGPLVIGCAQPNPDTAAGRSSVAGQQCTLCIVENPGDYDACHAICVQRVDDEAAYLKAIGR
jgi:hypothetical protein